MTTTNKINILCSNNKFLVIMYVRIHNFNYIIFFILYYICKLLNILI